MNALHRLARLCLSILFLVGSPALAQSWTPAERAPSGAAQASPPPPGACTETWEATFGGEPGLGEGDTAGDVYCSVVFDDGLGDGPVLFVGGQLASAHGEPVSGIARWDGSAWSDVGGGVHGQVYALAVTDFGSGSVLCVGGDFDEAGGAPADNLATWDGATWSAVGAGANAGVRALATLDGSPGVVMVGGDFTELDGVPATRAALWHSGGFLAFGDGFDDRVNSFAVHDGEIYAGGEFLASGIVPLNHLARWTGTLWEDVTGGVDGVVHSLVSKDSGPDVGLYVGGAFLSVNATALSARRVARWSASTWFDVGFAAGNNTAVYDLLFWDDGGGETLHATGAFVDPGSGFDNAYIASYDGSWSQLGEALDHWGRDLIAHDDGAGESLWVGGRFARAGDRGASGIARWDGADWFATGEGLNEPVDELHASMLFGGTPTLYLGGEFAVPGQVDSTGLVAWANGAFLDVGGTNGAARAFAEFDAGGGAELYVGGTFTEVDGVPAARLARYDGVSWMEVGGGCNGTVNTLTVFDDGSGEALYVGGEFTLAGGVPANYVARWDGSTWTTLGLGAGGKVLDLLVHDDGGGPALFVGGIFVTAGGAPASGVARWDGAAWSALGSGLQPFIITTPQARTLEVFDDGFGSQLYVGGFFQSAGNQPNTRYLARWDGAVWSNLGPNFIGSVNDLEALTDGNGCRLIIAGDFDLFVGFVEAKKIVSWNAAGYASMGPGLNFFNDGTDALAVFDDGLGGGPRLVAGGGFTTCFTAPASYLVSWGGCPDGVSAWTDLGFALAGVSGDPLFVGTGNLAVGTVSTANLSNAATSAMAGLFLSFASMPATFAGGTLVPWPANNLSMTMTSATGTIDLTYPVADCLLPGVELYAQWAIADGAAPFGYALSNAIVGVTP